MVLQKFGELQFSYQIVDLLPSENSIEHNGFVSGTAVAFSLQCAATKYPLKFCAIFLATARNFYTKFHTFSAE